MLILFYCIKKPLQKKKYLKIVLKGYAPLEYFLQRPSGKVNNNINIFEFYFAYNKVNNQASYEVEIMTSNKKHYKAYLKIKQ